MCVHNLPLHDAQAPSASMETATSDNRTLFLIMMDSLTEQRLQRVRMDNDYRNKGDQDGSCTSPPACRIVSRTRPSTETVASCRPLGPCRSEEHTSELQSLMRNSYAVFC